MNEANKKEHFIIPLWFLWAVAICFIFAGLGSVGLLNNNEGLYAEIPREMLASNNWRHWVIPHLNGLPYMEKPPLLYWLTAISFYLFGESEWSARLVPAVSSLACVALLLWFGNAVNRPHTGRLSALMFVSGLGVLAMSRVLMFDMLLTALVAGALMCAYCYLTSGSIGLIRYSYAFLAFGVLAKGFVVVAFFSMIVIGYMTSTYKSIPDTRRIIRKIMEPWSIVLFLVIAVPWHVAASLVEPTFAWFYFINEHILRFLGIREPHGYYAGAWWYYLPRIVIYLFPWSFLIPCFFLTTSPRPAARSSRNLLWFIGCAWIIPLVFFSLATSKANYYMIVGMPFAAFHLASMIESRDSVRGWAIALPGILIAGIAALAAMLTMIGAATYPEITIINLEPRRFIFFVLVGLALLALGCATLAWLRPKVGLMAYVAISGWMAGSIFLTTLAMEPLASMRQVAEFLKKDFPTREVYLYRDFEDRLSSLPFYLKKSLPIVDSRSNDLYWAAKLGENNITISEDRFVQKLSAGSIVIVVDDRQLTNFTRTSFFAKFTRQRRIGSATMFFN